MFRVHLDEESELWKDAMYAALPVGKWTYVALVYDAKKGNILLFEWRISGIRRGRPGNRKGDHGLSGW